MRNIDDGISEELSEIGRCGSSGNSWIAFGRYLLVLKQKAEELKIPYAKFIGLRKDEVKDAVTKAFSGINKPNYDEWTRQISLPESEQDKILLLQLNSSIELYERCGPKGRDLLLPLLDAGKFGEAEKVLETRFPYR